MYVYHFKGPSLYFLNFVHRFKMIEEFINLCVNTRRKKKRFLSNKTSLKDLRKIKAVFLNSTQLAEKLDVGSYLAN